MSLSGAVAACSGSSTPGPDAGPDTSSDAAYLGPSLSREELMQPEQCKDCHPKHYREWASSMHAYAARDPVFIAMNQRGQRETQGELGDFCVRCHAPMAVREGATTDGLNLDQLPSELKGVTCYFCHAAVSHDALFNNGIQLQEDGVMRGPIGPNAVAVDPGVHGVAYSPIHDSRQSESSALCGSCHDVVTPADVHMERTYDEYSKTIFANEGDGFLSCQSCHMEAAPEEQPVAEIPGVALPKRKRHSHLWPAVDVALTPDLPDQELQREAVQCELNNSLGKTELRAEDPQGLRFRVTLETNAGHSQPSGAAQDRRMWLEAIAYDAEDNVLFESGNIADDELEEHPVGSPGYDPWLTMFRDRLYDAAGHEVHMFWEAERSMDPSHGKGYLSYLLPAKQNVLTPHALEAFYTNPGRVAKFVVRVRLRPVGMDILQSLVDSGDLDPDVLAQMPTFTLGTATWRAGGPPSVTFARPENRCTAGGF